MQQAFDGAVYVGANLLGIRVDRPPPPTLTQYLQAAALGVLVSARIAVKIRSLSPATAPRRRPSIFNVKP